MTEFNGTEQTAQSVLRLRDIVLEFPCEECGHLFEDHTGAQGPCRKQIEVEYTPEEQAAHADAMAAAPDLPPLPPLPTELCGCSVFVGLHADGTIPALKLRQPSNYEWSTIEVGASIPVQTGGPPDAPLTDKVVRRMKWARKLCKLAVTHVRLPGGKWQPIRVVDTDLDISGPWDVSIHQLDQGGGKTIEAISLALVHDYNDGGPFAGKVRRFRSGGADDVLPARDGVPLQDAARASVQPAGHTRRVGSPG